MPPPHSHSTPLHDVVIIGAGASGLCAARHLLTTDPSLSILLLEALPHVGGRVHTATLSSPSLQSDIRVDLGAEFIHGSTTLINELVRENGWPTVEVFTAAQGDGGPDDAPTSDLSMYGVYFLNESKTLLRYDSDDADFVKMNEAFWSLSTLDPADIPSSLSIADHFQQSKISTRMTGMSNAGYSNTSGCSSLHELSLKRTVEYERHWKDHDGCCNDDGGDCRLSPPLAMSDVIDHVAADVDVRKNCRTNTKVLKVDYAEDTINIETSSEPGRLVQTKKVVVTVPVRIMIDGDIEFNPPLPAEKIEALSLYGMEDALKLFLVFRTRVWPEKVQNCIIADAPIPEMWFRSTPATSDAPSVHICCCFATAKFADSLKALKEPDATTAALKLLADMFDRTIDLNRQELLHSHMVCWSDVESVRGGYSFPRVGITKESVETIAAPLASKVFFAGEATHTGAAMTVHAAMETGIRAAEEVLKTLQPTKNLIDTPLKFMHD